MQWSSSKLGQKFQPTNRNGAFFFSLKQKAVKRNIISNGLGKSCLINLHWKLFQMLKTRPDWWLYRAVRLEDGPRSFGWFVCIWNDFKINLHVIQYWACVKTKFEYNILIIVYFFQCSILSNILQWFVSSKSDRKQKVFD